MSEFVRCVECRRHVRVSDDVCPFCSAAGGPSTPLPGATKRLGRAALFAFGATLAGCGATPAYGVPPVDSGTFPFDAGSRDSGTTDAGTTDAGTTDAGTADAGMADAGATDAGPDDAAVADAGPPDAGFAPPYGAPADPSSLV